MTHPIIELLEKEFLDKTHSQPVLVFNPKRKEYHCPSCWVLLDKIDFDTSSTGTCLSCGQAFMVYTI